MAEVELRPAATLVLDTHTVEAYIRDTKLAALDAMAYVVVVGAFAALRIFAEVPYLRAAVGMYVVASVVTVPLKRMLLGGGTRLLVASAVAGLLVGLPVLLLLVERNRGTLFAEAVAALVTLTVVHLADRVAVARA